MTNHPNRGNRSISVAPEEIILARKKANLTQTQAAQLVYRTLRQWQRFEAGERIDPAVWELFNIKISQLHLE